MPKKAIEAKLPVRSFVQVGEVYSAAARKGRRYVRVIELCDLFQGFQPTAMAKEILASGIEAYGWLNGVNRTLPFTIALAWDAERAGYKMPSSYQKEDWGQSRGESE